MHIPRNDRRPLRQPGDASRVRFICFPFEVWKLQRRAHATNACNCGNARRTGTVQPAGSISSRSQRLSSSEPRTSPREVAGTSHVPDDGSLFFTVFCMDAKKKNSPPAGASPEAKRAPIKVFTADDVSAAVFAHDHPVRGEMRTYHSVSFTRWYRDKAGENRYVNSFGLEDLGKVVTVAKQSDEYIRALQTDAA